MAGAVLLATALSPGPTPVHHTPNPQPPGAFGVLPAESGTPHGPVSGADPAAVTSEASYLTAQQPVLFQPNNDQVYVWKNTLSGPRTRSPA